MNKLKWWFRIVGGFYTLWGGEFVLRLVRRRNDVPRYDPVSCE